MDRERWGQWLEGGAALVAWLAAGVPWILAMFSRPELLAEPQQQVWLAGYVAFLAVFRLADFCEARLKRPFGAVLPLAVETLLALLLVGLDLSGLAGVLLVITAAHSAFVLPLRGAVVWVFAQTAGMVLVEVFAREVETRWVIAGSLAYLGFQVFAVLTASLALKEQRAREDLARTNAELVATQELLAESSRMAERVRISRELHDLLGHHLTSLSLNLEVVSHLTEGEAREHVEQARSMARLLLSDVREAVREIREDGSVDLAGPLRSLVADVPSPRVHLSMPEPLVSDDPDRAHAVLRCVQEVVTNSVRHAGARNLWIDIERQDGELVVQARDDGRGTREIRPGRGLTGMRERLERMQGRLRVDSAAGAGFTVEARLPLPETSG